MLGVDHPYEVKSDETPSLLPEKPVAVRFHSIGGWGAITTGKNLGAIIGDLNDLLYDRDKVVDELGNPKEIIHVSANPKYGSEKKGAPTSYFMVAAPERIRVNCDLRHVTVVLCCDPKAFTHTNPLDGMLEGGALIWESDEEGEQAWERLPMWARKQIIDKNIRVYTLPGFEIARKATDRADLQLRMQGNAFLGAFFAVSPILQEFRITQEQFRDVVHKQYVKKFGRLGDAVVNSNMEVMTQGFERVREIRVGEMAGAGPFFAAREAAAAGGSPTHPTEEAAAPDAARTRVPAGQGPRTPVTTHRQFDSEFRSNYGYNQPASPLVVGGRDGRRQRRHRLQIRRAPRNAALHSGKLHAVHGVHRGLPGHGAAELLAGSGHAFCAPPSRNYVTDPSERAKMLHDGAGNRKAHARHDAGFARHQSAHSPSRNSPQSDERSGRILGRGQAPILRRHRKSSHGLPEGQRHLLDAGTENSGSGGIFSIFVSDLCKGCAACVTACGDHKALRMVQETEEVNAEHLHDHAEGKVVSKCAQHRAFGHRLVSAHLRSGCQRGIDGCGVGAVLNPLVAPRIAPRSSFLAAHKPARATSRRLRRRTARPQSPARTRSPPADRRSPAPPPPRQR